MTMINMLRGGKANGPDGRQYTQNMYPRPDYKVADMARNDGWENRPDSFHYVEKFDLCLCWNSGAVERAKAADATTDECTLEVGDIIPLVWVPNRSTVRGFTVDIVGGVEGVVLGVQSRHFTMNENIMGGTPETILQLTGLDAAPFPPDVDPIDQAYLDSFKCGDRIPLDEFCGCDGQGNYYEWDMSEIPANAKDHVLVGGGTSKYAGFIVDLVIEALPADLDCSQACLNVDVGARVQVPRAGN